MACSDSAQMQYDAVTGTSLFEAGTRSRCSRVHFSRGRPQQCTRTASRTSSSRFGSRASSARSRSSTGSRRPSMDVELRGDMKLCEEASCATGFIGGILANAMDDIVTELDYYSDDESQQSPAMFPKMVRDADHVVSAGEPNITEELDDDLEIVDVVASTITETTECSQDDKEADDNDSCDFSDDVCSEVASDDGEEMSLATFFAQSAVSDDVIREAVAMDDAFQEQTHLVELKEVEWDSQSDDNYDCADFIMEAPPCGAELAFNFASTILDGAFEQAVTSWTKQEDKELSADLLVVPSQAAQADLALQALKEKAKMALLGAAKNQESEMQALKQRARAGLLKAAEQKCAEELASQASQMETLKLKVQKALSKGVQTGSLPKALNEVTQAAPCIEQKVRQALMKGVHNGELAKTFDTALQEDKWDNLRNKVRQSLVAASSAGKLKAAVSQTTQQSKDDALKLKVRQALLKGVSSGELSNTLATAIEEDKWKAVQSKVQQSLLVAAKSGTINSTVAQGVQKADLALTQKVRQALSKGLRTGELSGSFSKALEKDTWSELQNKVQQNLVKATSSGQLKAALGAAMRKADPWEALRNKVQNSLRQGVANGNFAPILQEATASSPLSKISIAELPTSSTARSVQCGSRSHKARRVIGGVVRAPAMKAVPAIRMDLCTESEGQEDSVPARASSLTRSYDTLGAQVFSLSAMDSPAASTAPKLSKARSRMQEASMSAMAMDLKEAPRPVSQMKTRPASMSSTSLRTPFLQSFAPAPLKLSQKMCPSASLGSLASTKVKVGSGGLLPFLAPQKTSAASIAWTMQMSKTASQWSNTGLRGSASMPMIF